jgi:hypothetical protein
MTLTSVGEDALRMIANGKTAAGMSARAADPASYDHYRTAEGLYAHVGSDLAKHITHLLPGDALAAEMAALDASLAVAMAELEAARWTQADARAALREAAVA